MCERYVPCLNAKDVARRLEWAKQHLDYTWTGTENLRYPNVLNRKVGWIDIEMVGYAAQASGEGVPRTTAAIKGVDKEQAVRSKSDGPARRRATVRRLRRTTRNVSVHMQKGRAAKQQISQTRGRVRR